MVVTAVLLVVSMLASYVPSSEQCANPITALRYE